MTITSRASVGSARYPPTPTRSRSSRSQSGAGSDAQPDIANVYQQATYPLSVGYGRLTRRRLPSRGWCALRQRVAGLLVLLYAQPVSRIAMLTVNRIHTDTDGTHLRLGNNPIRLPPPLDHLIGNLVQHRAGHTAVARTTASPWLFPGAAPGRPLSAPQLAARLRSVGIPARLARNSALIDLAAQLPAAVLSQLLGIHLQTATAWTIEAATPGSDTPPHSPPTSTPRNGQ